MNGGDTQLNEAVVNQNPVTRFGIIGQTAVAATNALGIAGNVLRRDDNAVARHQEDRFAANQSSGADFRSTQVK